ncbi:MAG: ABC transporter permease [Acidobacteriaceae bacterium]|nr:ABC transporter permease [Acidobacteriaceae bacterium]
MNKLAKNILFYAILLGAWYGVARSHIWPPYLIPAPGDVYAALHDGFKDHSIWIGIRISMQRVIIGYLVSVVLGFFLGLGISTSKFLEDTLGRLLTSLQSLPSICWLPLAILWFGLTDKAIYFVIIMGSLFSITMSMESSRAAIPRIIPMAGRNLGAKGIKLFWYVLLPASLPHLISGLKQGWAFAWRALISAEMIIISLGLGQLLMTGRDLNDMSQVVAILLVILVLGWAIDALVFRTIERKVAQRWGLSLPA